MCPRGARRGTGLGEHGIPVEPTPCSPPQTPPWPPQRVGRSPDITLFLKLSFSLVEHFAAHNPFSLKGLRLYANTRAPPSVEAHVGLEAKQDHGFDIHCRPRESLIWREGWVLSAEDSPALISAKDDGKKLRAVIQPDGAWPGWSEEPPTTRTQTRLPEKLRLSGGPPSAPADDGAGAPPPSHALENTAVGPASPVQSRPGEPRKPFLSSCCLRTAHPRLTSFAALARL